MSADSGSAVSLQVAHEVARLSHGHFLSIERRPADCSWSTDLVLLDVLRRYSYMLPPPPSPNTLVRPSGSPRTLHRAVDTKGGVVLCLMPSRPPHGHHGRSVFLVETVHFDRVSSRPSRRAESLARIWLAHINDDRASWPSHYSYITIL
jgi:hypothetical protein